MCGFSSSHNVESGGREKCAGTVKAKPGEEETLEASGRSITTWQVST